MSHALYSCLHGSPEQPELSSIGNACIAHCLRHTLTDLKLPESFDEMHVVEHESHGERLAHLTDSDNSVRGDQRSLQDVHRRPIDGRPTGILPGQRVIPAHAQGQA